MVKPTPAERFDTEMESPATATTSGVSPSAVVPNAPHTTLLVLVTHDCPVTACAKKPAPPESAMDCSTKLPPPPPPLGVAHVPSPRQNVALDAPVPLLRLVTGKLPVTSLARLTCWHVATPAADSARTKELLHVAPV